MRGCGGLSDGVGVEVPADRGCRVSLGRRTHNLVDLFGAQGSVGAGQVPLRDRLAGRSSLPSGTSIARLTRWYAGDG